jgi:hypothetical protein
MIHPLPSDVLQALQNAQQPGNKQRSIGRRLKKFERDANTIMDKLLGIFGGRK